jgi:predicted transposase YbfD/YdcC
VYARALGVALAQKSYDTHESSERAALKELLTGLDHNGVLIQADALHTSLAFFGDATASQNTASTPRGPT